jgi:polysaccharide export outer membrane protein
MNRTEHIRAGFRGALLTAAALAALGAGCRSFEYTDINAAVLASANVERRLEKINGRYILGATDSIQLIIPQYGNLSGGHTIRPDGYITLELLGDIYIEGYTPMQAADVLARSLQTYIRDVEGVTVRVTGFNSKRYYMFGETPGVGEQVFTGDVTVLSAFGRARGVTNRAAWDRIRLVRATTTTRQIFKINLSDIVKYGDWRTNVQLKANDVVYVPPTYLARVGYFLDNLLFPFRSVLGAMGTFNQVSAP